MNGRVPLACLILVLAPFGCSGVETLESTAGSSNCPPEGCVSSDAGTDSSSADVSTDIGNDVVNESSSLVNPLCGVLNCDPDDDQATKCNAPAADAGSDGGGAEPDAASPPDDADPDVSEDSANMGASMGGSNTPSDDKSPDGPIPKPDDPKDDQDEPGFACQVTADSTGERIAMCVPGGIGVDSDPCVTSADCAAGFACVGATAGVCRAYCCFDPEACAEDRYCGVRPSRDSTQKDPTAEFLLPVCIPAEPCKLLPGPDGNNGCDVGLMCAIVRSNGTTACVEPGTATEGEPCEDVDPGQSPCAEGFVCSKSTNTCLALCSITAEDPCNGGVCQGGTSGMPMDYGVCVGARD